jgi:hypothetical protein
MKLFVPQGVQVTLPVPVDGRRIDYACAFAAVTSALDAGFLAQAPGLEEGEEKEQIGWVLCGTFERDGETTPYVLLYAANEARTWSVLKVYLNHQTDIDAFEYASGMKLDKIPDYIGDNKPQRGAARKTDDFIIKAPKPFGVVYKKNPKHNDTEEGKMKPARLFVRWENTKPVPAAEAPPTAAPQQSAPAAPTQTPPPPPKTPAELAARLNASFAAMVRVGLCATADEAMAYVHGKIASGRYKHLNTNPATWDVELIPTAMSAAREFAKIRQEAKDRPAKQPAPGNYNMDNDPTNEELEAERTREAALMQRPRTSAELAKFLSNKGKEFVRRNLCFSGADLLKFVRGQLVKGGQPLSTEPATWPVEMIEKAMLFTAEFEHEQGKAKLAR